MADFESKVRVILKQNSCYFVRHGKGDHDIWYSPITNRNFTVDGKIKSRHTANAIISSLSYADFEALLARETYFVSLVSAKTYEITETETKVVEETEIPYYQALLDNAGYPAPTKAESTSGKQINAEGATFKKSAGTCYVAFAHNNALCRTDTISISGLNTDTDLSKQQQGITVKVTAGAGTIPSGFTATYGNTQATRKSSSGSFTSIILPFSVVTSFGYNTVVTNATTNEYTFDGTSLSINIAKNAGIGTSTSSTTSNATMTFNIGVNEYTIAYNGNGATSGSVASQTYKADATYTHPANGYERSYEVVYDSCGGPGVSAQTATYSFNGWATTPTATSGAAVGSTATFATNTTMYATWTPSSVTLPVLSRDGYTFLGWRLADDDDALLLDNVTDTSDYDPELIKEIEEENNCIFTKTFTPTEDTTLYAKWRIDTHYVDYTVNYYVEQTYGARDWKLYRTNTVYGETSLKEVGDSVTPEVITIDNSKYTNPVPYTIQLVAEDNIVNYYYTLKSTDAPVPDPTPSAGDKKTIIYNIHVDGTPYVIYKDDYGWIYYIANGTKHYVYVSNNGWMLEYTVNSDRTLTITKGFATSLAAENVTIPSTIQIGNYTYKVTAVGNSAFANNMKVKSVTISAGIKKLGSKAFYGCERLAKVTFKSADVTEIGTACFKNCKALKSINLNTLTKLKKIPDSCFENCSSLTKVTIPKSVTQIGKKAFYGCKKLATVQVKTSKLKKVGSKAFKNCKSGIKFKVPSKKVPKYKALLKGKY